MKKLLCLIIFFGSLATAEAAGPTTNFVVTKISEYPNTATIFGTNLFVIADPHNVLGGGRTNYNISFDQLLALIHSEFAISGFLGFDVNGTNVSAPNVIDSPSITWTTDGSNVVATATGVIANGFVVGPIPNFIGSASVLVNTQDGTNIFFVVSPLLNGSNIVGLSLNDSASVTWAYDGTNITANAVGGGGGFINPIDGFYPYRSNSVTFGDGTLFQLSPSRLVNTNAALVSSKAFSSGNNVDTIWGIPLNEALVAIRVPGINGDASVPELWLSQNTSTNFTADYGFFDAYPQTSSSVLTVGQKSSGTISSVLLFANGTKFGLQYDKVGSGSSQDLAGTGSPEGALSASVGSTYRRYDGGAGTSFYVKESGSGNTGWVAMDSGAGLWSTISGGIIDTTATARWLQQASGTVLSFGYQSLDPTTVNPAAYAIAVHGDQAVTSGAFENGSYGVMADGFYAGHSLSLDNSYGIDIRGFGSGNTTTFTNSNSITINGFGTAYQANFLNSDSIDIHGHSAAQGANFDTAIKMLIDGESAAFQASFNNVRGIDLIGDGPGYGMHMTNSQGITFLGLTAGYQAIINDSLFVTALGAESGAALNGSYTNVMFLGKDSTAASGTHDQVILGPLMSIATGDPAGGTQQPWQFGAETVPAGVTNLIVKVGPQKYRMPATPIP